MKRRLALQAQQYTSKMRHRDVRKLKNFSQTYIRQLLGKEIGVMSESQAAVKAVEINAKFKNTLKVSQN